MLALLASSSSTQRSTLGRSVPIIRTATKKSAILSESNTNLLKLLQEQTHTSKLSVKRIAPTQAHNDVGSLSKERTNDILSHRQGARADKWAMLSTLLKQAGDPQEQQTTEPKVAKPDREEHYEDSEGMLLSLLANNEATNLRADSMRAQLDTIIASASVTDAVASTHNKQKQIKDSANKRVKEDNNYEAKIREFFREAISLRKLGSPSNVQAKFSLNTVQEQAAKDQNDVIIISPPGTGKTRALAAAVIGTQLVYSNTMSEEPPVVVFTSQHSVNTLNQMIYDQAKLQDIKIERPIRATTLNDFATSILQSSGYKAINGLEYFRFVVENLDFSAKLYPVIYNYYRSNSRVTQITGAQPGDADVLKCVLSDVLPSFDKIRTGVAPPLWNDTTLDLFWKWAETSWETKGEFEKLYNSYIALIEQQNTTLFPGDAVTKLLHFLRSNPNKLDVVAKLSRTEHVFVDNFQQISSQEHVLLDELLKLTTASPFGLARVFVAGDDDQVIGSPYGAHAFQRLIARMPSATIYLFRENYRNSEGLMQYGRAVISDAFGRLEMNGIPKHWRTVRNTRVTPVQLLAPEICNEQVVCETVLKMRDSFPLGARIAVVAESEYAQVLFEKLCLTIDSVCLEGAKAYKSRECSRVLAILYMLSAPEDTITTNKRVIMLLESFNFSSEHVEWLESYLASINNRIFIVEVMEGLNKYPRTPEAFKTATTFFCKEYYELKEYILGSDNLTTQGRMLRVLHRILGYNKLPLWCGKESDALRVFVHELTTMWRDDIPNFLQYIEGLYEIIGGEYASEDIRPLSGQIVITTVARCLGTQYDGVLYVKTPSSFKPSKIVDIIPDLALPDAPRNQSIHQAFVAITRAKFTFWYLFEATRAVYPGLALATVAAASTSLVKDDDRKNISAILQDAYEKRYTLPAIPKPNLTVLSNAATQFEVRLPHSVTAKDFAPTISVSHIKVFMTCPLKFYYKYAVMIPIKASKGSEMGTIHHEFIRIADKQPHLAPEDVLNSIQKHRNAAASIDKKIRYNPPAISSIPETDYTKNRAKLTERGSFSFILSPNIRVFGAWDKREVLPNGDVILFEWKANLRAEFRASICIQMLFYAWAHEQPSVFGKRVSKVIAKQYGSTGTSYCIVPTDTLMKLVEDLVRLVAAELRRGILVANPVKRNCQLCEYESICPSSYREYEKNIIQQISRQTNEATPKPAKQGEQDRGQPVLLLRDLLLGIPDSVMNALSKDHPKPEFLTEAEKIVKNMINEIMLQEGNGITGILGDETELIPISEGFAKLKKMQEENIPELKPDTEFVPKNSALAVLNELIERANNTQKQK